MECCCLWVGRVGARLLDEEFFPLDNNGQGLLDDGSVLLEKYVFVVAWKLLMLTR